MLRPIITREGPRFGDRPSPSPELTFRAQIAGLIAEFRENQCLAADWITPPTSDGRRGPRLRVVVERISLADLRGLPADARRVLLLNPITVSVKLDRYPPIMDCLSDDGDLNRMLLAVVARAVQAYTC